jgi:hypothetical protein
MFGIMLDPMNCVRDLPRWGWTRYSFVTAAALMASNSASLRRGPGAIVCTVHGGHKETGILDLLNIPTGPQIEQSLRQLEIDV